MKLRVRSFTGASLALWLGAYVCCWVLWHVILGWSAGEIRAWSIIIPHDGWIPFNTQASLRYLAFLDSTNGGIEAPLNPAIHFLTIIVWSVFTKTLSCCLSINAGQIQLLIMSFSMTVATYCSYYGFRKIGNSLTSVSGIPPIHKQKLKQILLVMTSFYILSPPVLVYMSYGVAWTLSIALSIGLLPLSIGLFISLLESPSTSATAKDQIAFGVSVGLITLALLLFFPLLMVLAALMVPYFAGFKTNWRRFLLPALIAILIASPTLYAVFTSLSPGTEFVPDFLNKNAAYGSISGGVLTPLFERSAWILYNVWEPRLILNFYSHFYSIPFTATVLAVLFLVIYIAIWGKRGKFLLGVLLFLILTLFFIKGANPPFGQLFVILLNNIPIFSLIRTPDTKLSIIVHLAYTLILFWGLITAQGKIRYLIVAVSIIFAAINVVPIVNGSAPFASQSGGGYLIELSEGERKIAQILSSEPPWTRVLTIPPTTGDSLRSSGFFTYSEPLKLVVPSTFLQTGIEEVSSTEITRHMDEFKNGNLNALDSLNVNYVIIRMDRLSRKRSIEYTKQIAELRSRYIPVVESDNIVMLRHAPPSELPMRITDGGYSNFDKSLQAMSLYSLVLTKPAGASVILSLSNTSNKNWRLVSVDSEKCTHFSAYICATYKLLTTSADVYKPIRPSSANVDAHNVWELPSDINLEGKTFVVVFMRQLWMVGFIALSLITLIFSFAFVLKDVSLSFKNTLPRGA